MSTVLAFTTVLTFAGCLTLLTHPLLRFLRASEVPAALLIACAGRRYRRRLRFILRSRRADYLEAVEGIPSWHALAWQDLSARWGRLLYRLAATSGCKPAVRPEKVKLPGPVTASLLARGPGIPVPRLNASRRNLHDAGTRPVHVITDRKTHSARVIAGLDRGRLNEEARWARLEANWKDIR